MSLINDALRKARQAASERDAPPADLPFRGERIHSSRRGHQSNGPVFVVLIAVAAGLFGAAIAWWGFGRQQAPVATAQTDPLGASTSVGAEGPLSPSHALAAPGEPNLEATAEHRAASETPPPPPSSGIGTESESETAARTLSRPDAEPVGIDGTQPQTIASAEEPNVASGEREFVLDADLGYASLSLGYIVFRPTDPFAEINGIEVHHGSEIEGFTVEKIERDHVQLRDSRGPLVLRVP